MYGLLVLGDLGGWYGKTYYSIVIVQQGARRTSAIPILDQKPTLRYICFAGLLAVAFIFI
jgi:hypothetical protein